MIAEISELKEGMTLDEDVTTREGRIILKKGFVLTQALIEKIRAMGIQDVSVLSNQASASGNSSSGASAGTPVAISPEIEEFVQKKCLGLEMTPLLEGLATLAKKHLQEMLLEEVK